MVLSDLWFYGYLFYRLYGPLDGSIISSCFMVQSVLLVLVLAMFLFSVI